MGLDNARPARIASLDQFRGYTVAGMFVVNFLGSFAAIHPVLKHHNTYCSYADTIMPQFFFAVGFAYRLTFLRRVQAGQARSAYGHAITRNLGLILLGIVIYHLDGRVTSWGEVERWWSSLGERSLSGLLENLSTPFQRLPFQTLVHIGVTSLWVLPVIAAGAWVRVAFMLVSALLHLGLSAGVFGWSYYDWVMKRPGIDGGPLGFLTWTIPLLAGSLAYDVVAARGAGRSVRVLLIWGLLLSALGYGASCLNRVTPPNQVSGGGATAYLAEPPFVPPEPGPDGKPVRPVNLWTMSQRAGSVSYLTFGAGFSLLVYALFVVLCDLGPLRVGVFRTLGSNALAAYIIHELVAEAVKPYAPRDGPLWFALTTFGIFFAVSYLFVRHLEKHNLYLRL